MESPAFSVPPELEGLFPPGEIEEVSNLFQEIDADGSGMIDSGELATAFASLGEDHLSSEDLRELMEEADANQSGSIDFGEFLQLLWKFKKSGKSKFSAFSKVFETLNDTPNAVLQAECDRRHLKLAYDLQGIKEATSSHGRLFVMEVRISGKWSEISQGTYTSVVETRKFQGIGKNTREAKTNASITALSRLKKFLPGIDYSPGEIPQSWKEWFEHNIDRGVDELKLLQILKSKGFFPTKNLALMQKLSLRVSIRKLKEENSAVFPRQSGSYLPVEWVRWAKEQLRRGFDGKVLLETLADNGFDPSKQPQFSQSLSQSLGGSIVDKISPYAFDFWSCAANGEVRELLRYVAGGHDLDEPRVEKNVEVTALTIAIRNGQLHSVEVLVENGAAINAADVYGRSSGHVAARAGNVDVIRLLISHGADFTTPDHYGDTPLHIAASYSKYDAMRFILEWQNERTRRLLSGRDAWVISGKRLTFEGAVAKLHTSFLKERLSPYATPLFDKSWIYDAIKSIHTTYARLPLDAPVAYGSSSTNDPSQDAAKLDTSNVIEFVELLDPKKVCTIACPSVPVINAVVALYDLNVHEAHVDLPQLVFLMGRCFAEAYTNNQNKIGNTPLIAACASCARGVNADQKKIIHILLDEFGCETRVRNNAGLDALALLEQKLSHVSTEHAARLDRYNAMVQAEKDEYTRDREPLVEDRLYQVLYDSGDVLKQWRKMRANARPNLQVDSHQEYVYQGDVFYFDTAKEDFRWNRPKEVIDEISKIYEWDVFRRESIRVRQIHPWDAFVHATTGQLFYVRSDTKEVALNADKPLPCEPLPLLVRRHGWRYLRDMANDVDHESGWSRFTDPLTNEEAMFHEDSGVGKYVVASDAGEDLLDEASCDLNIWRKLRQNELELLSYNEVIDQSVKQALQEGNSAFLTSNTDCYACPGWSRVDVVDSFSFFFYCKSKDELWWRLPVQDESEIASSKLSFQRRYGDWEEQCVRNGGPNVYIHKDGTRTLTKPAQLIQKDRENAMWALLRGKSELVCTLGHWTKWSTTVDWNWVRSDCKLGVEDGVPLRQVFFWNKDEDRGQWERPSAWSSLVDETDLVCKGGREKWFDMKLSSDKLLSYQCPFTQWEALREPNTGVVFYWNINERSGSWRKPEEVCKIEQKKLLYRALIDRDNGRKPTNLQILKQKEASRGLWREEIDRFRSNETKHGTVLCLYYMYEHSSSAFGLAHNEPPMDVFEGPKEDLVGNENTSVDIVTKKAPSSDSTLSEEDKKKFAEDLLKVCVWIEASQERASQGFVLCWWGCKTWIEPEEATNHQNKHCIKRLAPCALKCPLVLRVEQWAECEERHTTLECSKRKVPCDNLCGEEIVFEKMEEHLVNHCIKRPAPVVTCSLGCGWTVHGGIEDEALMKWEAVQHEENACPLRLVRCDWKNCAAEVLAKELAQHRKYHLHSMGIFTWVTPGQYKWRVPLKCKKILVQVWGAGGGGGFLYGRKYSCGGCGGFVQAEVHVFPQEELTIHVGSGGEAGKPGVQVEGTVDDYEQGCAKGGHPGGGDGFSSNEVFACGGGGGYSAVYRKGPFGHELMILGGGGGGAGSRPGLPGGYKNPPLLKSDLPFEWDGGYASQEEGGKAGIGGASTGTNLQAGSGAEFGGGGGGGWFGGGGGGFTPGIAGGGGGGSSFAATKSEVEEFLIFEAGTALVPGGMEVDIPAAVGLGDWDIVGGPVGLGGLCEEIQAGAGVAGIKVLGGNAGAVRIRLPGFYTNSFVAKEEDLRQNMRGETPATVVTYGSISTFSEDCSSYRPPSAIVSHETSSESSSEDSSSATESSDSDDDEESENLSARLRQADEDKNAETEFVVFQVGDKVMAHYEGIPSNPEYAATITAVHGDDTYDVLFDDGEKSELPISKFVIRPIDE